MDWTVNDGLYHRFLKWHLKCENILECELSMLPEKRQCKKVIAWSHDFGIDQYVSWSLLSEELMPDTILEKCEEFCKPQSNEVRARFDLLTSFLQGNKSVDGWYNAVQTQVALAKYPQKQPRYFIGTSSGSSSKMKNLSLRLLMIATLTWTSLQADFKGDHQAHQAGGK